MRVIALIEDPQVIRRILEHLGQWAPQAIANRNVFEAPAGALRARPPQL